MPYFFRRRHRVTGSSPRTLAASSNDLVAASTCRICRSSIRDDLLLLAIELLKKAPVPQIKGAGQR